MRSENRAKSPQGKASKLPHIGWREWICLPDLCANSIKAKVDTGARSSALHAFHIRSFQREGEDWLQFDIHPTQHRQIGTMTVEAKQVDERAVRSSNGLTELRPVITTPLCLGAQQWLVEITLTDRDAMGFRMLLGRQAMRGKFLIDPGRSYLQGQPTHHDMCQRPLDNDTQD